MRKIFLLLLLFFHTWAITLYHVGVMTPPLLTQKDMMGEKGIFYDKKTYGVHQVVLSGGDYWRGLEFGRLTKQFLFHQEKYLTSYLDLFFPHPLLQRLFFLSTIRFFWGLEREINPDFQKEMLGVSLSTSHEFDYLGDRFTRQMAYHGIHEVGQMFIGYEVENKNWGCTVFGAKTKNSWMVGRNFDFEAGPLFDQDKIMKWSFPERGHAYLSVIWAGMVGSVTGVNDHGLYVSINAAGSSDFSRFGTLSTLLVTKVLQEASNSEEALKIFQNTKALITDIFVVVDSKNNKAYRIEKSPLYTAVMEQKEDFIVTNHLNHPHWKEDWHNLKRQKVLSTLIRQERGLELLTTTKKPFSIKTILSFLRDKKLKGGKALELGDRRAIDAQIATHSVLFDGEKQEIYVSEGPSLTGRFWRYDLKKSFELKKPIPKGAPLPKDSVTLKRKTS